MSDLVKKALAADPATTEEKEERVRIRKLSQEFTWTNEDEKKAFEAYTDNKWYKCINSQLRALNHGASHELKFDEHGPCTTRNMKNVAMQHAGHIVRMFNRNYHSTPMLQRDLRVYRGVHGDLKKLLDSKMNDTHPWSSSWFLSAVTSVTLLPFTPLLRNFVTHGEQH